MLQPQSADPATTSHLTPWQRVSLWSLAKALGTMGGMAVFFAAYFWVLRHPSRSATTLPLLALDEWVDVSVWAFPVYCLLWVYVPLMPALMCSVRALWRFGLGMACMCTACLLIYWWWPTQVPDFPIDWRQYPGLAMVKGIDQSGNACPSLHVASMVYCGVWGDALLQRMRQPAAYRWLNALLVLAVTWSTLATKQHVAIDVLAGAAVGLLFATLSRCGVRDL